MNASGALQSLSYGPASSSPAPKTAPMRPGEPARRGLPSPTPERPSGARYARARGHPTPPGRVVASKPQSYAAIASRPTVSTGAGISIGITIGTVGFTSSGDMSLKPPMFKGIAALMKSDALFEASSIVLFATWE